ncbi:MAG: hypothetical protein QOG55_2299 [Acidobacteriaceae bacterium]|jgi:hypothetical protein|nr:hypothetical protein [Acidobacteriaceae bacterium]
MHSLARPTFSTIAALVMLAQPIFAFQSPLSDESVREAYFLGQRHDGSLEGLVEKSTRHFPAPKTGPYISSLMFVTPFVNAALLSSNYIGNYSAQQAELDHRQAGKEIVKVTVQIQLTETYGQFIAAAKPNSRPASTSALIPRPDDFWRDFQVQIFNGDQALSADVYHGRPNYSCGEYGPCILIGATLTYEFPAEAFSADSASITVEPPEGESVTADFDLSRLR